MNPWLDGLRQLARYPSAIAGLALVLLLIFMALYSVVSLPYGEALERWRGSEHWRLHPVNARPIWSAWLTGEDLPATRVVAGDSDAADGETRGGVRQVRIPLAFDYGHRTFPSELKVFLTASGGGREPFARLSWRTPDGRTVPLGGYRIAGEERLALSQDWTLEQRLGRVAHVGLLAVPSAAAATPAAGVPPNGADARSGGWPWERVAHWWGASGAAPDQATPVAGAASGRAAPEAGPETAPQVLPGRYELVIDAILFDPETRLSAELAVYGRVHGWAGTDHRRRDLMTALLWGTPVALAFGLLAAVGTTFTTLIVAAAGVWFGGWIDALIQRLTEVNIILPLLPILVMVGTLYSTGIWIMLGVVIALGILGAGIKMYRAMLLPIRHAPYIEAARAYGAGDWRIVLRYLIPRILPVLIPTFVTLIPSFVFLEASLALLGLGDPVLPTWGKILNDAQAQSALYNGHYYWVLEPAALLMLTGLGFAMLGFALDRVFNPRLRSL